MLAQIHSSLPIYPLSVAAPIGIAVSMGGIYALWSRAFQSGALQNIEPLSKQPLIKITSDLNPTVPLFHYLSTVHSGLRYDMPYDLCQGIKDEDWESMTNSDRGNLGTFHSEFPCAGINTKLLLGVTKAAREIARKSMGFSNPDQISAVEITTTGIAGITPLNRIIIEAGLARVLNGFPGRVSHQQASGIMAHEIAHRVLQHNEQQKAFELKQMGITVESLEAASDFLASLILQKSSKTEAGNRITQAFNQTKSGGLCTDPLSNEIIQRICCDPALEKASRQEFTQLMHIQEKEADLLTFKDPYLAKGLRNWFDAEVLGREALILNMPGHKELLERAISKETLDHPPMAERRDYMTDKLCHDHREENLDICPEK